MHFNCLIVSMDFNDETIIFISNTFQNEMKRYETAIKTKQNQKKNTSNRRTVRVSELEELTKISNKMNNVEHTLMSDRRPDATGEMAEPVVEPAVDVVMIAADELCRDEKYSWWNMRWVS